MSTFIRLLKTNDKAEGLRSAIQALQEGTSHTDTYQADEHSFRQIPKSPFAYWVSDRIRKLFVELPSFESEERTVKQGLATADDFRFVRLWWEVPPSQTLDGGKLLFLDSDLNDPKQLKTFQKNCRKQTMSMFWVPFAKGGEYSPYYADLHLVVNWRKDGEEMKEHVCQRYPYIKGNWSFVVKNPTFYFRPGVTWSRRSQLGFSPRAVPAGVIFSDKGPVAFTLQESSFIGIANSSVFALLISLQMAFGSYEVGVIQRTPVPVFTETTVKHLQALVQSAIEQKRRLFTVQEGNHVFQRPALLRFPTRSLAENEQNWRETIESVSQQLQNIQRQINQQAYELYQITDTDKEIIEASYGEIPSTLDVPDLKSLGEDLLSWLLGTVFGVWDIRFALGSNVFPELPDPFAPLPICAPVMLQNEQGLPMDEQQMGEAHPAYPLSIPWNGMNTIRKA